MKSHYSDWWRHLNVIIVTTTLEVNSQHWHLASYTHKDFTLVVLSHPKDLPKHNNNNLWVTVIKARRKRHQKDICGLVDCKNCTWVIFVSSSSGPLPTHLFKNNERRAFRIEWPIKLSLKTGGNQIIYLIPTSFPFSKIHCNEVLNISLYSGPKS